LNENRTMMRLGRGARVGGTGTGPNLRAGHRTATPLDDPAHEWRQSRGRRWWALRGSRPWPIATGA